MQDLNKIENEYLQANDAGDDAPTSCITREFAEQFEKLLHDQMILAAGVAFEQTGMGDLLSADERQECFKLLSDHISDAIGDMPIWGI
jgi:hypothetical protein